jgi:TonB-dependent SusC/RagA subfamily outer membrane receptor
MRVRHTSRIIALGCGLSVAFFAACSSAGAPPASAPNGERAQEQSPPYGASAAGTSRTLASDELRNQRVTRIEELFQGRVAGVQVIRQANGNFSVRVRGTSSIMGSNEPLFVVDGMPINQYGLTGALAGINPGDVSHIQVLKDPSDTSMYGMRGANGVIVITTKRGR